MQTVKIDRIKLLEKIKVNRQLHVDDYANAVTKYRKVAIEKLTKMLQSATNGGDIGTSTYLTVPVTKLAEYDRVITMLEMSIDDNIDLTSREFDSYVLDNWDWKHNALLANSTYR